MAALLAPPGGRAARTRRGGRVRLGAVRAPPRRSRRAPPAGRSGSGGGAEHGGGMMSRRRLRGIRRRCRRHRRRRRPAECVECGVGGGAILTPRQLFLYDAASFDTGAARLRFGGDVPLTTRATRGCGAFLFELPGVRDAMLELLAMPLGVAQSNAFLQQQQQQQRSPPLPHRSSGGAGTAAAAAAAAAAARPAAGTAARPAAGAAALPSCSAKAPVVAAGSPIATAQRHTRRLDTIGLRDAAAADHPGDATERGLAALQRPGLATAARCEGAGAHDDLQPSTTISVTTTAPSSALRRRRRNGAARAAAVALRPSLSLAQVRRARLSLAQNFYNNNAQGSALTRGRPGPAASRARCSRESGEGTGAPAGSRGNGAKATSSASPPKQRLSWTTHADLACRRGSARPPAKNTPPESTVEPAHSRPAVDAANSRSSSGGAWASAAAAEERRG